VGQPTAFYLGIARGNPLHLGSRLGVAEHPLQYSKSSMIE